MLTRQSPQWICQACLAARTRPTQYCRLIQTTSQSTQSNDPVPPKLASGPGHQHRQAVRRVPLRELLQSRKAEQSDQSKVPDPVEKPQNIQNEAEETRNKVEEKLEPESSETKQDEPSGAGKQDSITQTTKKDEGEQGYLGLRNYFAKAFPLEKFNMNFRRRNTPNPLDHPDLQPTSTAPQTTGKSTDFKPDTPTPEELSSVKEVEPVLSTRQQKNLETIAIPLPSAPRTRVRRPIPKKHRQVQLGPPPLSPLALARLKVSEAPEKLPDTGVHPGDPINSFTGFPGTAVREVVKEAEETENLEHRERIWSEDIQMKAVAPLEERPVPVLEHGLDRVPGVTYLRDPRSLVYNFDPYLEHIMPTEEFDYGALYEYITSSRDQTLVDMAKQCGASFVGSTSSMTAVLSHFHFLLSAWRPVNIDMLSTQFATQFKSFTAISRAPAGIFLRYKGEGVYAIDADKMYDTSETVLSWLGRSMEKMLTLPPEQMEKFRKSTSHTLEPHERGQPEAYHYTHCGTILMRSQLDCHDARLPGTGVFDLKTRACIAVRMDVHHSEQGADYEIHHRTGVYNSFEREYYDMIRSAFLKYSLQVRIGKMDGIFVAYHNTKRIFGFQYIPLEEMDFAIHGSGKSDIGRREFNFSIKLLNEALDRAVRRFPKQSLRLTFETRDTKVPMMYILAEPFEESEIDAIQTGDYIQALRLAEERARATEKAEETQEAKEIDEEATESSVEESESPPPEESTSSEDELNEDGLITEDIERINDPDRELLAMVLRSHNFINGTRVTTPPTPTAHDKWEITYDFEIYSPERGKRILQMCQDRRRRALDEEHREQALEESEKAKKSKEWNRSFLLHLKDLSARGKKWREEFEKDPRAQEKVVWHEEHPPSRYGVMTWRNGQSKGEEE